MKEEAYTRQAHLDNSATWLVALNKLLRCHSCEGVMTPSFDMMLMNPSTPADCQTPSGPDIFLIDNTKQVSV